MTQINLLSTWPTRAVVRARFTLACLVYCFSAADFNLKINLLSSNSSVFDQDRRRSVIFVLSDGSRGGSQLFHFHGIFKKNEIKSAKRTPKHLCI